MSAQSQSPSSPHSRFHHRRKNVPSRGRGFRGQRPAVFREPVLLESEQPDELNEEEVAELEAHYAKRTLSSNADRYEEPEPEIGSDGQPIVDPEVDLSALFARQRLEDSSRPLFSQATTNKDDDVDPSLAHINPNNCNKLPSRKGKVQEIEWDASLEEMEHNKNVAQARSDLKERLRASAARQMGKTAIRVHSDRQARSLKEAPQLPQDPSLPQKSPRAEMEAILDKLLD